MSNWLAIELTLGVILVSSFTSIGLLALWAAVSPRHWLLRSIVMLAVLSPLLVIPAYEPWIVFALQIGVIFSGVLICRWVTTAVGRNQSERSAAQHSFKPRFSLRTLFAITALVAVLTAIVTRIVTNWPEQNIESWITIVLNGLGSSFAVLLGAWVFAAKRKRIAWPGALAVCLGLGVVMARFDWFVVSVQWHLTWPPSAPSFFFDSTARTYLAMAWVTILATVTTLTWLMIYVWLTQIRSPAIADKPTGRRRGGRQNVTRCVFALLLLAVATPPALIVGKLLYPPFIPTIVVPQPNGFDDIMAAGKVFRGSPIWSIDPASTDELASEIAAQADAYEQLRLGLRRKIQAPVWTSSAGQITARKLFIEEISAAYAAARVLKREAELALQQNRFGDSATIAIETMLLGQAVTRGGVSPDYGIGFIFEGYGDQVLYQVLPQLEADQCREMIAALVEIEDSRGSLDEANRRLRAWGDLAGGWFDRFRFLLADFIPSYGWHQDRLLELAKKETATRLLILELALHAFQREHGRLPERPEQLTPDFLDALPIDPFDPNRRPLRYVHEGDDYIVYSVSVDGKDDGGRAPAPKADGSADPYGDGDLRLDTLFPADDDVTSGIADQ
jgi:hypothetical protein